MCLEFLGLFGVGKRSLFRYPLFYTGMCKLRSKNVNTHFENFLSLYETLIFVAGERFAKMFNLYRRVNFTES